MKGARKKAGMSPLLLEMLVSDRLREHNELVQQALEADRVSREAEPLTAQPGGLRRRLGRKLVSLGLRLDPQSEGPAAS